MFRKRPSTKTSRPVQHGRRCNNLHVKEYYLWESLLATGTRRMTSWLRLTRKRNERDCVVQRLRKAEFLGVVKHIFRQTLPQLNDADVLQTPRIGQGVLEKAFEPLERLWFDPKPTGPVRPFEGWPHGTALAQGQVATLFVDLITCAVEEPNCIPLVTLNHRSVESLNLRAQSWVLKTFLNTTNK